MKGKAGGFAIAAAVIMCVLAAGFLGSPGRGALTSAYKAPERPAALNYKLSFIPSARPQGRVNTYVPKPFRASAESVRKYAVLFGMESAGITEGAEAFTLRNGAERLIIHKDAAFIEYENAGETRPDAPPRSDEEAVRRAEDFLAERGLFTPYEEVKALKAPDGGFTLSFINRLGNLKNYAFPQVVRLDAQGRVTGADYYFISYEKIGSGEIKTMEEALAELPPAGEEVDLRKGQLVYFYENSVVQAAWFFEGETGREREFECFIPATVYD